MAGRLGWKSHLDTIESLGISRGNISAPNGHHGYIQQDPRTRFVNT